MERSKHTMQCGPETIKSTLLGLVQCPYISYIKVLRNGIFRLATEAIKSRLVMMNNMDFEECFGDSGDSDE